MTQEELRQFYWLNIEIKKIEEELQELKNNNLYNSPVMSDMPKSKTIEDIIANYMCKVIGLQEELQKALIILYEQRLNIENYISGISDTEIRLIMRLRHVKGLTWEKIGEEIHMSKTGVIRKYKRYLVKS